MMPNAKLRQAAAEAFACNLRAPAALPPASGSALDPARRSELDNLANLGVLLGIHDATTLLDVETFLRTPETLPNDKLRQDAPANQKT